VVEKGLLGLLHLGNKGIESSFALIRVGGDGGGRVSVSVRTRDRHVVVVSDDTMLLEFRLHLLGGLEHGVVIVHEELLGNGRVHLAFSHSLLELISGLDDLRSRHALPLRLSLVYGGASLTEAMQSSLLRLFDARNKGVELDLSLFRIGYPVISRHSTMLLEFRLHLLSSLDHGVVRVFQHFLGLVLLHGTV